VILKRNFYQEETLNVAKSLLGCFLVHKIGNRIIKGIITETEAYIGEKDLACHASRGRTKRTETMYGEAGQAYVYMIYGMYHCLNVVTGKKNFPAAVLIRGVKPLVTIRTNSSIRKNNFDNKLVLDGPGKICRHFQIDRKLNGWDLARGEKLWIVRPGFLRQPEAGQPLAEIRLWRKRYKIKKSKRIGIDYAGHCRHYLWRFHIEPERQF